MAYVEDNVVFVKLTENETDVQAAKLRSSTVEDHSLANRHSCSTSAETRDRKCFITQLILVVRKMNMNMINQIC